MQGELALPFRIANLNALTHDAVLVLAPAEAGMARPWERPASIDKSASETFFQDCDTLLGWMLNADLENGKIEKHWTLLL